MSGPGADLVIVGGGLAGLAAANRARERGLSVLLLERGREDRYLCNSRLSFGYINVAMEDIGKGPEALRRAIRRATGDFSDPDQVDLLAGGAGHALAWLRAQGARTIVGGPYAGNRAMLAPPVPQRTGLHWSGRGADLTLRRLVERFEQSGGTLMRGVEVGELLLDRGRVVGVGVVADGARFTVSAPAVLLADGGFQSNLELVRRYISPAPDRLLQRNAGTGLGAGLAMAETTGAALAGLDRFYGHLLSRDAMTNDRLWPYPTLDFPAICGMAVTADGRRFTDEGLGGISIANAIARLDDPLGAFAVFDDATWRGPARHFTLPTNPHLVLAGGTIFMADTLQGLAAKAGIAPDGLVKSASELSSAVAVGWTDGLTVPRSVEPYAPRPIATPPFYAVPLCVGITYTMGGPTIDGRCRVRRRGGGVVLGLYAAGSTTGGLEGGPRAGYTGGLSKALVTGLRAADGVAEMLAGAAAATG